jgi:tetratricopeptide (TPR) repeat protein
VEQKLWTARIRRLVGEAYEAAGDKVRARELWRGALRDWEQLLGINLLPEWVAEAQIERGRCLYALGRIDEGLRAFETAIDVKPERAETYIDAIAFLVPRGYLAEALDAFHRALGRGEGEVSEYFRVYVTLWVRDLLRRSGEPPDPVAESYLQSLPRDGRWYYELAHFAAGTVPFAKATSRADTKGKKAEVLFYEAMNRLAAGKADEARALWKQVLDTEMMGFFEYDMAQFYLRHGAPSKPAAPRATPPPAVPNDAI